MAKPEIRLKGFKGEWEEKTFLQIVNVNSGMDYKGLNAGNIPVYGTGGYMLSVDKSLSNEDAIGIGRKGTIDSPQLLKAPFWTIDTLFFMTLKKGYDLNFIYSLCQTVRWKDYDESTGVPSLSKNNIDRIESFVPNISEQKCIANYFKSLDSMIQGVTKKIASLKQMKHACLVSMFPQAGETIPRVRFKGFKGEWECSPLSTFSKKVTNKNSNLEIKITLTNSAEYGIINQLDFFDHDVSNGDNIRGYYVVDNDDFVYNPRVSTMAPVGPINRNQLGYAGVMSPLYYVFRVSGIDKDYLSCFFKTNLWHKFMKDNGNSGARFDRLSITDDMFVQMPILYPKSEGEQKQIASFFTSLDRQISLQEQRLEKLKQIKTACLDKMFV